MLLAKRIRWRGAPEGSPAPRGFRVGVPFSVLTVPYNIFTCANHGKKRLRYEVRPQRAVPGAWGCSCAMRAIYVGSTRPSEHRGAKLLRFDGVAVCVCVSVGVAACVTHCPALATVPPLRIGRGLALLAEEQRQEEVEHLQVVTHLQGGRRGVNGLAHRLPARAPGQSVSTSKPNMWVVVAVVVAAAAAAAAGRRW
jgi:hypothetical protein